jgi:hypothetical protein
MKITFKDIQDRKSVRTYQDKVLDPAVKETLVSFIGANSSGPFGTKIKFEIIDLTGAGQDELKQLASYGNIKGPKYFMAGAVKYSRSAVLDYGYLMEHNILAATALGLGTCWVGGTFSRVGFLEKMNGGQDWTVPAVVPVGYGAKIKDVSDTATRLFVAGDTRRPWKDIFFDGTADTPLAESAGGVFAAPLAALRLAPSASNKQPWRVIKDGDNLHIFLERTPGYNDKRPVDIQLMDLGIAMCNFDIIAEEAGMKGAWKTGGNFKGKEGWEYVGSRE